MKSFFTQLFFIAALAFTTSVSAQIAQWDFDGDLQGWTVNSIIGDSVWKWSPNGDVGNGLFAAPGTAIQSPTANNGCAVFNNDFYTTGGTTAPTGNPPFDPYVCELISPVIDMSSVTGVVALQFAQLVRPLNLVGGATFRTSFQVSADGGANWSPPQDCNPNVAPNDPPTNSTGNFPLCGLGIEGSSQVQIKFTMAMDFYYWVIDDISLFETTATDMRSNDNFYAIAPNLQTPCTQVGPMYFMNDIENVGGTGVSNVNLNVTINDDLGAEVHNASLNYGDVPACILRENEFIPGSFTPAQSIGKYTGQYSISMDETDDNPGNNTNEFAFYVTDTLFAKDTGIADWRSVRPAADQSFTWGCYYRIYQDGQSANRVFFDISQNTAPAAGAAGRSVTIWLWEWEDTNGDDMSQESERIIKALTIYDITGTESWQADDGLISVKLEGLGGPDDLILEAGKGYIVGLQYQDDLVNPVPLDFAGQQGIDYAATVFQTDSLEDDYYSQFLDVGNTGEFSSLGFGNDLAPVAYLSITPATHVSTTNLIELDDDALTIFPNPASYHMNVEVELNEVEDLAIEMFTMDGKKILSDKYRNVQRQTVNYNIGNIPNGVYNLTISTGTSYKTKSVTIQH